MKPGWLLVDQGFYQERGNNGFDTGFVRLSYDEPRTKAVSKACLMRQ
jgi:hypothetical protein